MGELFQQFLNRAKRGYGQIDKNVFGGLLPGGAATPIGAAFQGVTFPKGIKPPSPTTRRIASVIDAATGVIAGAQPFVEKTIKAAPEPIQGAIASGLNALPFSVNLFSRYYTGLGNKNLEVPESATAGIKEILDKAPQFKDQVTKERQSMLDSATQMLADIKTGKLKPLPGGFTPSAQMINDDIAEFKSDLKRIKEGDIPFDAYRTTDVNPLTSPATSLGRLWFEPAKDGYVSKEKYDFVYGGIDKKTPMGPRMGPQLTPTQDLIINQMLQMQNKPRGANFNQLTDFGRAIVGKMPSKSFEYLINIP